MKFIKLIILVLFTFARFALFTTACALASHHLLLPALKHVPLKNQESGELRIAVLWRQNLLGYVDNDGSY